jgi:RIO kinase 1
MKTPARLQVLIDEGLIDSVLRQLKSGKEAEVFVVRCGEDTRAAVRRHEIDHGPRDGVDSGK